MKKIFRYSALVAMVSMMATATVATSCSDDDDEEPALTVLNDTVFTVTMGGSASVASSYLSIMDCKTYSMAELNEHGKNVEIVFTGSTFISAQKSVNDIIKTNNRSAVITQSGNLRFDYETSTGYKGSLTLTEEPGDQSAEYVVTVVRQKK